MRRQSGHQLPYNRMLCAMRAGKRMRGAGVFLLVAAISLTLAWSCGGDREGPRSNESYDEGKVRVEVELLDTGLIKGHAYADAAGGHKVAGIKVTAVDHKGASWNVLEPEISGIGSQSAKEFFEVVVQEIPRGKQVTIAATATFESPDGSKIERTAADVWPP